MANPFIYLPDSEILTALNILTVTVTLIYLVYLSQAVGGGIFALLFSGFYLRDQHRRDSFIAHEVLRPGFSRLTPLILLGVLPPVVLMLLYAQMLYGTEVKVFLIFSVIIVLNIVGLAHLYIFRSSFTGGDRICSFRFLIACAGLFFLLAALFVFVSAISFFHAPEQWPLIRTPVPLIFSANVVARFALYLNFIGVLFGVGLFCFGFVWTSNLEARLHDAGLAVQDYLALIRKVGLGSAVAAGLGLPVFVLWTIITLPVYSTSSLIYGLYLVSVLSILIVVIELVRQLWHQSKVLSKSVATFIVLALALVIMNDQLLRTHALKESYVMLEQEAIKHQAALDEKRGIHGKQESTIEAGKQVYTQRCVACHDFNNRLVGPPYKETIPAYKGDLKALTQYILNPVKKNEGYPPMPNLGLKTIEAESVAKYLLHKINQGE